MRTWGAITVALALGAGSVGAACGSEVSGTPDMGSPGDASTADATTDAGPQTFTIADAEPPPSRDEELAAVFVAACGAPSRPASSPTRATRPWSRRLRASARRPRAHVLARGVVEVDVDGGRGELVVGDEAEQPDAAVLVPRAVDPGATRTRRTAGAATPRLRRDRRLRRVLDGRPRVRRPQDPRRVRRRRPRDRFVGAGRPVAAAHLGGGASGRVGRPGGRGARARAGPRRPADRDRARRARSRRRRASGLRRAPRDLRRHGGAHRRRRRARSVDSTRGDAWIALAAEGRVVVGVHRATAQTCDPRRAPGGRLDGGARQPSDRRARRLALLLGTRDGAPVCGRTDLGVPIDHLGVYGCGIADNASSWRPRAARARAPSSGGGPAAPSDDDEHEFRATTARQRALSHDGRRPSAS